MSKDHLSCCSGDEQEQFKQGPCGWGFQRHRSLRLSALPRQLKIQKKYIHPQSRIGSISSNTESGGSLKHSVTRNNTTMKQQGYQGEETSAQQAIEKQELTVGLGIIFSEKKELIISGPHTPENPNASIHKNDIEKDDKQDNASEYSTCSAGSKDEDGVPRTPDPGETRDWYSAQSRPLSSIYFSNQQELDDRLAYYRTFFDPGPFHLSRCLALEPTTNKSSAIIPKEELYKYLLEEVSDRSGKRKVLDVYGSDRSPQEVKKFWDWIRSHLKIDNDECQDDKHNGAEERT